MSLVGRLACAAFLVAALMVSACGDPPDKEMQQAQGAIDAARAAGADQYAHDEFVAAQEALTRANEAVGQRDYRLALNHALDSRERAQNAAKEAADQKAIARADADRALVDATAALEDARQRLQAAEAEHLTARTMAEPRNVIADAGGALQEARAAFERGEYSAVSAALTGVPARLRAAARDLERAAPAPAPRRRR